MNNKFHVFTPEHHVWIKASDFRADGLRIPVYMKVFVYACPRTNMQVYVYKSSRFCALCVSSLGSSPGSARPVQKAPAPNESGQILGRGAAAPFLTADGCETDQSQNCAAPCAPRSKRTVRIHCTHTFRHQVFMLGIWTGPCGTGAEGARENKGGCEPRKENNLALVDLYTKELEALAVTSGRFPTEPLLFTRISTNSNSS